MTPALEPATDCWEQDFDTLDAHDLPLNPPTATHIILALNTLPVPKDARVILEPQQDWPPNGLEMIVCHVPPNCLVHIIRREKHIEKMESIVQEVQAGGIIAISTNVRAKDYAIAFHNSTAKDYSWTWYFRRPV